MKRRRWSAGKILVSAVFAAGAAMSTSALTASNTVPSATAGAGSGTISGYTVSSVAYSINSSTPTNLDAVTFTLSATATTVKIKLVSSGSTWFSCTNTSGNNWSCTTTSPQATVAGADQLSVVAVQ